MLTARLAAASRLIRIAAFVQVRNKPGSTFHAVCLSPVSWGGPQMSRHGENGDVFVALIQFGMLVSPFP